MLNGKTFQWRPNEVAMVLPPREVFSPQGAGAISQLVHRLAANISDFRSVVVGRACANPYADVAFLGVKAPVPLLSRSRAYRSVVNAAVRGCQAVEVHNQPDLALSIAQANPAAKVSLFLHNDPLGMRGLARWQQAGSRSPSFGGTVCCSEFLSARLRRTIATDETAVIPNCIDVSGYSGSWAFRQREHLILFVGRVVADKGVDVFLEACRIVRQRLDGWRALVVGGDRFSPSSPITVFMQQQFVRATSSHVTLTGYQQARQIIQALSSAEIVVVPSRWQEPFGLIALEAMAAGACVIAADRGGLPDLTRGVAILCDPEDPIALADHIIRLASNPRERSWRRLSGRARARSYDVTRAAEYLRLYRKTLVS